MSDVHEQAALNAERGAWDAAKRRAGGESNTAARILLKARLATIERSLAVISAALESPDRTVEALHVKTLEQMRDYWEEVRAEVES